MIPQRLTANERATETSPAGSSRRLTLWEGLARVMANPARLLRRVLLHVPNLSVETKLALDLYDRPHYAYGIAAAAAQARALNIAAITCIEFGVGAGHGLIAMEAIAAEFEAHMGLRIDVVGFDAGDGLPAPKDFRDLPYVYEGGFYAMDEHALRERLNRAQLIIGPVANTIRGFAPSADAPIGFVACDLDYYSSTMESFSIFDRPPDQHLPRIICYLDDISNAEALQISFAGEELAVEDFNRQHEKAKIGQMRGLAWSRAIPAAWNDQIFVLHLFEHPLYGRPVVAGAASYVRPLA